MRTDAQRVLTRLQPALADWPDAGVYQLRLRVSVALRLTVGRLGRWALPAGDYVYTGRAARGLRARVRRHLRGARCRHWHIDYLLAQRAVQVTEVWLASRCADEECVVNQRTQGRVVIPGFGASDCRRGCGAHLLRLAFA